VTFLVHRRAFDVYRRKGGKIWKEYGALEYRECIGDDFEVKDLVPFPRLAGAQPDETVVFAWITFQSREHRDAVNAKAMADPRIKEMCDPASPPLTSSAWRTAVYCARRCLTRVLASIETPSMVRSRFFGRFNNVMLQFRR